MTKDEKKKLIDMCAAAKAAALKVAGLDAEMKKNILKDMAAALRENSIRIIDANAGDVSEGKRKGLSSSLIDRLTLNADRIETMARSMEDIADMSDPVGEEIDAWTRPNGMRISRVRVPIGVIAIIYEARPNVTSDCVALCLKSSNIVILRGGSDAVRTNQIVVDVLRKAASNHYDGDLFFFVENTDHASVDVLLKKGAGYIDLVIPRGGKSLIRKVVQMSRIPVIKHYEGICHVYVDRDADLVKATAIAFNAKVQRPSVCNAMETLLVHKDIASVFLPMIAQRYAAAGVEMRGDTRSRRIVPAMVAARKSDFGKEFLDLIVAVKVVDDIQEAIEHINRYGSLHTDSIVTENEAASRAFLRDVQSACVFANLSTRFSDGGEFGLGAEMGISTDKLHARGPMGLRELTTYKYVVHGNGQIRT